MVWDRDRCFRSLYATCGGSQRLIIQGRWNCFSGLILEHLGLFTLVRANVKCIIGGSREIMIIILFHFIPFYDCYRISTLPLFRPRKNQRESREMETGIPEETYLSLIFRYSRKTRDIIPLFHKDFCYSYAIIQTPHIILFPWRQRTSSLLLAECKGRNKYDLIINIIRLSNNHCWAEFNISSIRRDQCSCTLICLLASLTRLWRLSCRRIEWDQTRNQALNVPFNHGNCWDSNHGCSFSWKYHNPHNSFHALQRRTWRKRQDRRRKDIYSEKRSIAWNCVERFKVELEWRIYPFLKYFAIHCMEYCLNDKDGFQPGKSIFDVVIINSVKNRNQWAETLSSKLFTITYYPLS